MKYILVCALLLAGCYSERKAKNQFAKAAIAYPVIPAEYCAKEFPSKDSVIVRDSIELDTIFFQDIITDTITIDSVRYIVKTETKVVTKTVRKDSIIYRNNPAEERRLQLTLQQCQYNSNELTAKFVRQTEELNGWQSKARKRFWLIFALIGAGVGYAAFKIKSFLT